MTALGLDFEPLAHNSHAQPFADKGQKKSGGQIHNSRRFLDVGPGRSDLDGDNVAVPVWVSECRHALRDTCLATALSSVPMIVQERREKLGHAIRLGLIEEDRGAANK